MAYFNIIRLYNIELSVMIWVKEDIAFEITKNNIHCN